MNELIRSIYKNENKTDIEYECLRQYYTLSIISEILVDASKSHFSSDEALVKIRECMQNNL